MIFFSVNSLLYHVSLLQALVAAAQSLVLLDLGMMIAVPTIVNGVLHNAKEGLSLNDSQSSWFGNYTVYVVVSTTTPEICDPP